MSVGARVSFLSPIQAQVDGLVGQFAKEAFDLKSLGAFTAGGLAGRAGRSALIGQGTPFLRTLSIGSGLVAEVSAFELTNRTLQSGGSNLWKWSGPSGLKQGLFQSFLTFGAIKGAGGVARTENFVLQQFLQDSAVVAAYNISGAFNTSLKPRGTLAEQFLHAQAGVFQVGAAAMLSHLFAPGLWALEKGLDLPTQRTQPAIVEPSLLPRFALAGVGRPAPSKTPADVKGRGLFFSKGREEDKQGDSSGDLRYPLWGDERQFVDDLYILAGKTPPKYIFRGNAREIYQMAVEYRDRLLSKFRCPNQEGMSEIMLVMARHFPKELEGVRTILNPLALTSRGDVIFLNLPKGRYSLLLGRDNFRPYIYAGYLNPEILKGISRRHAEIFYDSYGKPMLRDLSSKNGTYLNGARVFPGEAFDLSPGDRILVGAKLLLTIALKQPGENERIQ